MEGRKLLLPGATGFIGGSVLTTLVKSRHQDVQNLSISVLVRRPDQAKALKDIGAAREHDLVIHTASGFHSASAEALILGLGGRRRQTGRDVFYIHTSGTSNLADKPISGGYSESRTFSDRDNIYDYLKHRENIEAYAQRTTDLVVVQTGLKTDVKTYIIMSPTIWDVGAGLFNASSIQIPISIRAALKAGTSEVIGEGEGTWDHVSISDLVLLYELVLVKVLTGEEIPSGEKGIYFSANGRFTWKEMSRRIADAGFSLGVLRSDEVRSIDLDEAATEWAGGSKQVAELGFASNSRTQADLSRALGWRPRKTQEDFKASFPKEFELILKARK